MKMFLKKISKNGKQRKKLRKYKMETKEFLKRKIDEEWKKKEGKEKISKGKKRRKNTQKQKISKNKKEGKKFKKNRNGDERIF